MRRTAILSLSLLLMVVASGCGGSKKSARGASTSGGSLVGAGSTFVFPLVAKWIEDYGSRTGTKITYGPIGSGGGINSITNRTVDFGASDAPLTPDQLTACKGCVQIPWALAGTSIPYNLPGGPMHLKLTGTVIAQIFLGRLKSWNSPAIAALNPGAKLPSLPITPVHRSDSSGTTFNFTDYLSHVSPTWKAKVGTGTAVNFPAGVGGRGSAGVSALLKQTKGSIGYVDTAYSLTNGFDYAAVENRAGKFTLPTKTAVAAAVARFTSVPPSNAISIVDPPASAPAAYPVATLTYAIAPTQSSKAAQLRRFLTYAIGPGQSFGPPLQCAPLPPAILAADRRAIARIR